MATSKIAVNVYDGTRQLLSNASEVFVRIIDGNQKSLVASHLQAAKVLFADLPVYNNFGDDYTVLVSKDGYLGAGFRPVRVVAGGSVPVDVMLLPKKRRYDFARASWTSLKASRPTLFALLAAHAPSDEARHPKGRRAVIPSVSWCMWPWHGSNSQAQISNLLRAFHGIN
jgi:hypothetical protein